MLLDADGCAIVRVARIGFVLTAPAFVRVPNEPAAHCGVVDAVGAARSEPEAFDVEQGTHCLHP